jgi:hypothetical protein
MTSNDTLSLLHDGDSFTLDLEVSHIVRVLRVLRYENNDAGRTPVHEQWFDLHEDERASIIRQIQRRHKEKLIKVT